MSWSQRVFLIMNQSNGQPNVATSSHSASSGISTVQTVAIKTAALPLEYRGLSGEYDPQGLAKRVAHRLDRHPLTQGIKTLCILQQGNQINFLGKVDNAAQLQQVVELTRTVEGTKTVDVSQVVVAPSGSAPISGSRIAPIERLSASIA
jgi:hypothetical protein